MENILIDTDVVIEYLRNKDKPSTELIKLLQEHDVFLSSISEFELFLGARTDRHRNDLEMLFSEVDVIPFDFGCGKIAANIWKDLQLMHQHLEIVSAGQEVYQNHRSGNIPIGGKGIRILFAFP